MNADEREAWLAERLMDNFTRREVACPCGCDFATPNPLLMDAVQRVRNCVQAAIHVSSCCRCAAHNATLKNSSPTSQHILGNAMDVYTDGHFNRLLQCVYSEDAFTNGGIGIYFCKLPDRPYSWLHIDVRPIGRARWTG